MTWPTKFVPVNVNGQEVLFRCLICNYEFFQDMSWGQDLYCSKCRNYESQPNEVVIVGD